MKDTDSDSRSGAGAAPPEGLDGAGHGAGRGVGRGVDRGVDCGAGSATGGSTQSPSAPPIIGFARAVDAALDRLVEVQTVYLSATEKAEALVGLRRVQDRVAGLVLRVLAVSEEVAEQAGDRDVAAWLTRTTRSARGQERADLALGRALERSWARLGRALDEGGVNLAQARVIAHALEELPDDLPGTVTAEAEAHLVELAVDHGPTELEHLGRRILQVVAPDLVEAEEGRRLEDEERRAREKTSLRFKRLGTGATRIIGQVPDAAADRLATYLDAFTSPRQSPGGYGEESRIPAHRKRGQAFCALLEHLDPAMLPDHGGDATTVLVTLSLDDLRSDLAAAGVITSESGQISATEARRLACTAQLVPAVLGGRGEVLDLGRAQRLFTRAQRRALRLRDRHCRAEGCTIPAGWCEAHHLHPWSSGGNTDLADGILLCNWHHHRAHDDRYQRQRLPSGDLRFHRRT